MSKLKPCHYKYNHLKDLGDKIHFGFIAQDLERDFGSEYAFVIKDETSDFLKVNYHEFIAPIVSVLKEQEEEIKKLRLELELLKKQQLT